MMFPIIIVITIVIRLSLSILPSFEYDQSAYRNWSARLVEFGPSKFYSNEVFTNNPLGGLYMFWLVGLAKNYLLPDLSFFSKNYDILLKLPANAADIISGFIIYLLIKKVANKKWAIIGYLMYILNPALIFNSSIWGQYDGLATLFLLISTYMILIKKGPELSFVSFATAWTIKPQAIFFAPVLLLLTLSSLKPFRWLTTITAFLITILIIYFPFFRANPLEGVLYVNNNSANLFNCTTCFAFNFWGIFGNWQEDVQKFIGIPFLIWGVILLIMTFIPIFFSKSIIAKFKPSYFYLTSAISIMACFIFLTRMHERYLFPLFPFLLLAAISFRSKILITLYIFMSGLHLLNLYIPYAYYNNFLKITNLPVNILMNNFNIFSTISFFSFVLFFIYFLNYAKYNSKS